MPTTRGQGQSRDITEWKQRGIASAIAVNLRVFSQRFGANSRAVYQHFDLNAGSGINQDVGCIGSPLAFIQSIREEGLARYRAHFIDIDKEHVKALVGRSEMQTSRCFVFHGDNRAFIGAIPRLIEETERPRFAIGSVVVDPNGTDVPIDELAWLSRQCPRLDFIINWNSTSFKRSQGRRGNLNELMDAVEKRHWLVRQPVGAWQWTLLIGRNMRINDYPSMGFHNLDTDLGAHIFEKCAKTRHQINGDSRQGVLF